MDPGVQLRPRAALHEHVSPVGPSTADGGSVSLRRTLGGPQAVFQDLFFGEGAAAQGLLWSPGSPGPASLWGSSLETWLTLPSVVHVEADTPAHLSCYTCRVVSRFSLGPWRSGTQVSMPAGCFITDWRVHLKLLALK